MPEFGGQSTITWEVGWGGKADLQMRGRSTMPEESAVWVCLSIRDVKHELNYLNYKHSPLVKVILNCHV